LEGGFELSSGEEPRYIGLLEGGRGMVGVYPSLLMIDAVDAAVVVARFQSGRDSDSMVAIAIACGC